MSIGECQQFVESRVQVEYRIQSVHTHRRPTWPAYFLWRLAAWLHDVCNHPQLQAKVELRATYGPSLPAIINSKTLIVSGQQPAILPLSQIAPLRNLIPTPSNN